MRVLDDLPAPRSVPQALELFKHDLLFVYHVMESGRRRSEDHKACRTRLIDGRVCIPFTWDNVRGYATPVQQRLFLTWRRTIVNLLMDAMRSGGLRIRETGTPLSRAGIASDVDLNISLAEGGSSEMVTQRDICSILLGQRASTRQTRKLLNRLGDLFELNLYPYVNTPCDGSLKDTQVAYGDARFRLLDVAERYGLSDIFVRAGLEDLLRPGATSCTGPGDLTKIGTQMHCRYAKELNDVYLGYGAYVHIVLGIRDAPNRNWYLLSMLDNFGFLCEHLFDKEHLCYSTSVIPRLTKACKYLSRMSDAVILHDKDAQTRRSVGALMRKASVARRRGSGSIDSLQKVYDHLRKVSAKENAFEVDAQGGMYLVTNWLVLVLQFFKPYISQIMRSSARRGR